MSAYRDAEPSAPRPHPLGPPPRRPIDRAMLSASLMSIVLAVGFGARALVCNAPLALTFGSVLIGVCFITGAFQTERFRAWRLARARRRALAFVEKHSDR